MAHSPMAFPTVLTWHRHLASKAVSANVCAHDSLGYHYLVALEHQGYYAVDRLITVDSRPARHVREISGREPVIIYNFVDGDRFTPGADKQSARRILGLDSDDFVVLCPRHLTAKNGVRYAVEAMAHIRTAAPLLVGDDGEQKDAVEELTTELACRGASGC